MSLMVICMALATVCPLQAASLSLSLTDPVVDGADIALLPSDPGVTTVNDNESWTAAWAVDRPHQGQTFTTGADPAGYSLSAVSLLHNYYNIGWGWTDTGPWDIVIGTIDGSGNLNVIAQETIAEVSTFDGIDHFSSDGIADWMTFTLDTPVALAANTTYAFAVGVNNGGVVIDSGAVFVRSDNDADYTGGVALSDSVTGGVFNNPVVSHAFDRIFHLDLESNICWGASNPVPVYGATGVDLNVLLRWTVGDGSCAGVVITDHIVYLGTDAAAVAAATTSDPQYQATLPVGVATYDPDLQSGQTYYWRIDEYTGSETGKGPVWRFDVLPESGLVGHWKLDGDVTDSAGSGDGSVKGSGGINPAEPDFTTGWINQAGEFTGSGKYIQIPRVVEDDFTIALWVKTTNPGYIPEKTTWDWGKGLIGGKVVGGANDFGLSVLDSKFCFGVGGTSISSTSKITSDSWVHVAATRDRATGLMKVFVNGVEENTATGITNSLTSPASLVIGNVRTGWSDYLYQWACYDGLIDDVRMYNYVLSGAEIQNLAAGSTPIPPEIPCAIHPRADLNEDCVVNLEDFALMAWHWFEDNRTTPSVQWTPQKAWDWYNQLGPLAGCNYIPRNAINPTEMWQEATFDPITIDQELTWAQNSGINTMRVFIQYIVYETDPEGLINRMEQFLEIADSHNVSVTFALFDDCWGSEPFLGPQIDPVPSVHNSGWTESPGDLRHQTHYWPDLQRYVVDIVSHFSNDDRVIIWDLYNEAGAASRPLVEKAFEWARSANPSQPLTSCWQASDLWDIASYHQYGTLGDLSGYGGGRPFIFTETISRLHGCTYQHALPIFAQYKAGWYGWGLVNGKTQTIWPWGGDPGVPEPSVWFVDLLHPDGSPYDQAEIDLIRDFANMWGN